MRYILLVALVWVWAAPARAQEDACAGSQGCVMVFKIEPGDGVTPAQAKSVAGAVATAVGKVVVGVVETLDAARSRIEAGQERADVRQCDEFSCLQELGNALGVPFYIQGDLTKLDAKTWQLNLQISDMRSMKAINRESLTQKGDLGDVLPAITAAWVRPMLTGVPGLVLRAGAPTVAPSPAAVSVVPTAPIADDGPGVTFGVQGGTTVRDVGDLLVTGSPAGARVEIRGPAGFNGGRVLATTFPVKLRDVPAGEYKLRVTMSGYELWERSAMVAALDAAKVEAVMERSSGTLLVRGTPAGAGVTVACTGGGGWRTGSAVGLSEAGVRFEVPRGPCTVKVGATGWVGYEGTVDVAGGGETPVEVRLARVGGGGGCPSGWVSIPAGSYDQGCSPGDSYCLGDELPARRVTINRPLCMKATEVTQAEWKALSGGVNPSYFSSCGDDCPVEQVDWYSALAYANALSGRDGLTACYTFAGCGDTANGWKDGAHAGCTGATFAGVGGCSGYRLPTEAEWEYAARAGTTTATYGGNLSAGSGCVTLSGAGGVAAGTALGDLAWYDCNAGSRSHPVGLKRANPWGLRDMLGNVWEWTWDAYSATAYSGGAAVDPTNNGSSGARRVVRGGSWSLNGRYVRASFRVNRGAPVYRFNGVGFRLVRPQ